MIGKLIGFIGGMATAAFVAYCVYFDHQRHSDPDFKRKLRERRRLARRKQEAMMAGGPDLCDQDGIEKYFLQEIKMGEALISSGEFETGVEHLTNAILVCNQPTRLLQVLQASLPYQVFDMLITRMQEFGTRITTIKEVGDAFEPAPLTDDLE
ncbi:mitochondrial import receptor subunit TOM20 homolog [Scaptodrosophila lebanonensis]|uniref:Mitochondrial import receptor subunit TOM20 homolog n=1 Tax=Drosophila lebanonensis TaxID=7225 RepID=A0A6J2TGP6_DROLE|nr:mitochondrial import receptor subunit TOM20 homolog [Scaptodrosophila lebanonensis]